MRTQLLVRSGSCETRTSGVCWFRLLVRFDDPSQSVLTASVPARNGLFYLSVGEIESDIYLMDLVRK